ncbi:MAG: hypothetical protein NT133_13000 [Alphaproteobacteria bacterium]|nr:hypothetical protein [Alphaproteobacteria bacterium]
MTSAAWLWRRAPAWRGTVLLAALLTALAIAYPPAPPAPALSGGSYAPPPPLPEPFPNAPSYSGSIAFGGMVVPLPSGTWRQLNSYHSGTGKGQFGGLTLLRFAGRRVTGAILLQGSTEIDPAGDTLAGLPCANLPWPVLREQIEGTHAVCVLLRPVAFALNWAPIPPLPGTAPQIMRDSIATLQKEAIALPPVMLKVNTSFRDGAHWLQTIYHFVPTVPDPTPRAIDWIDPARLAADPARAAYLARATDWARRWGDAVARAYAGAREPIDPDLTAGPQ